MSELIKVENGEVTLDSRMIAEHFAKQHAHVLRDIQDEMEKLEKAGLEGQSIFGESSYINNQNKQQPCYTMNEEGAMQLAARYDAVARRKLILKIKELKEQQPQITSQFLYQIAARLEESEKKLIEANKEIEHKKEVIKGVTEDVDLHTKRAVLNRVVRHKGANFQERWRELYLAFKEIHGVDLRARCEGHNLKQAKKKDHLSTIKYAEKFGHIDNLYRVALKLYETEIEEILENIRSIA